MAKKGTKEVKSATVLTTNSEALVEEKPVKKTPVKKTPEVIPVSAESAALAPRKPNSRDHMVIINGREVYKTKDAIIVAIQQGQRVEIPKGTKITIPPEFETKENCSGCGR